MLPRPVRRARTAGPGIVAVCLWVGSHSVSLAADQQLDVDLTQANELGLTTFCKTKGYVDDAAIALKKKLVELAPSSDPRGARKAVAKGERGIHSVMGIDQSIAGLSEDHIKAICQSMRDLDRAVAERYGVTP